MGVREAVVVVMVVVAATGVVAAPQSDITLTASGYSGVTVAISEELDSSKCAQYVSSIKAMVSAASRIMFNATDGKVFFGDVGIVVPQEWPCQGVQFGFLPQVRYWDSAHLRVAPYHYLFGDNPWTLQPGGCGEPGDWVYLSEKFIMNNADVSSQGSMLVHEWAKYRWGVFEEYGHAKDAIFPTAFRDENISATPNYCTDHPLEGNMYCPDEASEVECQFTPETVQNATITSSLLAAPFLDTVVEFCDASSHKATVPTKHNLLCDHLSVKEVMAWHSDMNGADVEFTETKFNVVHGGDNLPRMVLIIDHSGTMGLDARGRWEQLRDNIRQFIKLEATADSSLGVVMFGETFDSSNLLPLNQQSNRDTLAQYIPTDPPTEGGKNLESAISAAAQMLGDQGGTLVLVTENLEKYTSSNGEVGAAAGNPVWPILYPSNASVSTDVYQQLANISPVTSVLTVQNKLFSMFGYNYQSVDTSADLHQNLLTAAASTASRVKRSTCNTNYCTIPLMMDDDLSVFLPEADVKIFFSVAESQQYINVGVKTPNGKDLEGIREGTRAMFKISSLQTGQYIVSVNGSLPDVEVIAELWATPVSPNMQVSVWSPNGLHNLLYSPGRAPRLLAQISNNQSWPVVYADVTAKVAYKDNPKNSINITLNDAGVGGDVTGLDGIYSGYLVGFQPNDDVTVTISYTDNEGQARGVNPKPTAAGSVTCCGSQLDLSNLQMENPGIFVISSDAISGRFTGEPPGAFPPGQVTDLRATRTGNEVKLTFTAPGAKLDQGQAGWYDVISFAAGEEVFILNVTGQPVGSLVEEQVTLAECDMMYSFTVKACFQSVCGITSNSVRESVSCSGGSNTLSGGAIAGIVIGCILAVLLIILIAHLCLNRDNLEDVWVWGIITCRCCTCCKKKDDDLYKQPSQARRNDVIRTNTNPSKPVRGLTDLFPEPGAEVTRTTRQDEDDGGFADRRRQRDTLQMRSNDDVESSVSSQSTLPINKVGLPVGDDNHGYDDGPYTISRTAPPVPRYPRANTQV